MTPPRWAASLLRYWRPGLALEYAPSGGTAATLTDVEGADWSGGTFVNELRPEASAAALRSALDGSMP
jgi:hypothetical protein